MEARKLKLAKINKKDDDVEEDEEELEQGREQRSFSERLQGRKHKFNSKKKYYYECINHPSRRRSSFSSSIS